MGFVQDYGCGRLFANMAEIISPSLLILVMLICYSSH